MNRKLYHFTLAGVLVLSLAACANNNGNGNNGNTNNANNNTGAQQNGAGNGEVRPLNRNDLGMNRDLTGNRGIGTNRIGNDQVRMQQNNGSRSANNNGTHINEENGAGSGLFSQNNARGNGGNITGKGTNKMRQNNAGDVNDGMTRRNMGNGGQASANHGNTRMERADDVAEKIAALKEIDSASVLLTDNNAYVAVELNDRNGRTKRYSEFHRMDVDQEEMTGALKRQIAKQVQQMEPDVENVYVSANPDFVDRVNGFMEQLDQGNPVRGLMTEFNEMMNRIFPQNAAGDRTGEGNNTGRNNANNANSK